MVAPIALYPDPLLGQILAASTYPLEVVQAQQWLQQNGNLRGQAVMDAARQQNWDPSVQALVAFPDVLTTLTRDVQWTTDLGNAFLAQQNDVMAAVQRMRQRAMRNGKLTSTPQQNVTTQTQDGQNAVVIEPADPQVIYVPVYNPAYIWGPPAWGYYPPLFYPGIGFGFGFGPRIYLGGFFPGWGFGWGGWGLGWGWGVGWFGGGLFVNGGFFSHYGFHGGFYGGARFAGGHAAWQHDPMHRAGVAYSNRNVAARYNNSRFAAGRTAGGSARTPGAAGRGFNGAGSAARGSSPSNRASTANGRGSFGASRGASPGYSRSYSGAGSSRGNGAANSGRSYSGSSQGSRSYSSARPSGGGASGGSRPSSGGSAGRSVGGGGSRPSGGGGHSGGRR
jgi:hypothetical protein